MISKRAFGADLPYKIKNKLHARQVLAAGSDPDKETDGFYEDEAANRLGKKIKAKPRDYIKYKDGSEGTSFPTETGALADLSSRTPFARMWTAVQLLDGALTVDNPEGGLGTFAPKFMNMALS